MKSNGQSRNTLEHRHLGLPAYMELSANFFRTVFTDAFIFGRQWQGGSIESHVNALLSTPEERRLALEIHKSCLYPTHRRECEILCKELSDTFRWASNSEGSFVFAGKILYLLRKLDKDVVWFKTRIQSARKVSTHQATTTHRRGESGKPKRATVIVQTEHGILLTKDYKGQLLLPGGRVGANEPPLAAAARELYEETRLEAKAIEFLFQTESAHYQQLVFLVRQFSGKPVPRDDAYGLAYFNPQHDAQADVEARLIHSHARIIRQFRGH